MTFDAGLRLTRAIVACAALALLPARGATAPAPAFGHAVVVTRGGVQELLVDGKPFFFWGGAFFYERIPASRWRDSMLAMKRLGANTLDLYVPWNWHELDDGDFDFDGHTNPRRNLREVLRLARELSFHLIVRPGPVIRNEWRNGGYPAWLLQRPEYHMPLRDVLDGRYPATATLQNAHSDDAAAEWMANRTHLRYASRWLHRALAEFRPVADLVLAVALDDDQGAYIDNQTYPAPHLQRYLGWLKTQVRDVVGPATPTFINTYEMRVPASSPVWTMGNWYQSEAFTLGEHDRANLDFATQLLTTNARGPLAQSEFQAGWLAPPEDPQPRPADPRNTELALHELLANGVHGIVDFPMQDTLAPFGWEAPFANALYNWDAALGLVRYGRGARYDATANFGSLVSGSGNGDQNAAAPIGFGEFLAQTAPVYDTAIAWLGGAYKRQLTPTEIRAIADRTAAELRRCRILGHSCTLVDLRQRLPRVSALVVPAEIAAPLAPDIEAALRRLRPPGPTIEWTVRGSVTRSSVDRTVLASTRAVFVDLRNWSTSDASLGSTTYALGTSSYVLPPLSLAAHSARLVPLRVDLSTAPGFAPGDELRPSTCPLFLGEGQITVAPQQRIAPCTVTIRLRGQAITAVVESERGLVMSADGHQRPFQQLLPIIGHVSARPLTIRLAPAAGFEPVETLSSNAWGSDASAGPVRAVASRVDVFGDGGRTIVLHNSRLTAIVSPDGGGRLVALGEGDGTQGNATDATGALRDDLLPAEPPTARDYIAAYTHTYPAGTAQRRYSATIAQTGSRAVVRLQYVDVTTPRPVTYVRVLTLEPDSPRLVVDERVTVAGGAWSPKLAAVQRSSLPGLFASHAGDVELFPVSAAGRHSLAATFVRDSGAGHVTVVAWQPGEIASASWTPYRSTGTLALRMTLGTWHRVAYAYAVVHSVGDARAFVEAERAWLSANPWRP